MMHLYLVRHGIAVEREEFKEGPDSSRPLTGKGRKRFEKAARAFARGAEKIDLILTSPLVRAVQTAEILAAAAKHGEVRVQEELAGEDVPALLAAVGKRAAKGSVALVGHEPLLSRVLAALAHLTPEEAAKLDFKKGSIVRIDVSDLPAAKSSTPRFWLKPRSGARVKGLPLQQPAPPPEPAARKGRSKAKPLPAKKASAARKKAPKQTEGAKKPERAAGKSPAQAEQAKSAPRRFARKAEKPAAAAPNRVAAASAKASAPSVQSFMGSPRPAAPEAPHADGATSPQSDESA